MALRFLSKILKRREEREHKDASVEEKEEIGQAAVKERSGEIAKADRGAVTGVLAAPHITEKTSGKSGENKYAFVVSRRANKPEVKRAIEARYGINVLGVNIVNVPGKERKRGKQVGWKQGYKKAIVQLKEGQTIEIQ